MVRENLREKECVDHSFRHRPDLHGRILLLKTRKPGADFRLSDHRLTDGRSHFRAVMGSIRRYRRLFRMENRPSGHRPRVLGLHHVEQDWLDRWQHDRGPDPCVNRVRGQ